MNITNEDLNNWGRKLLEAIESVLGSRPINSCLLSSADVKKKFRISATKLYEMRRDGKIPFLKVDGKYLYDYDELLNAFKNAGQ